MKNFARYVAAACLVASPLAAHAVPVKVQIGGVVDYNVIKGGLDGIPSGAPTTMSFMLDSNTFVDSGSFPTRGYTIDLASFSMTVGGVAISMDMPQPGGVDAYFVLRDNDPAIDGFFISLGGVDLPFPLSVHIPGLAPAHDLDFLYTFADGDTLSSLESSMRSALTGRRTSPCICGRSAASATTGPNSAPRRSRSAPSRSRQAWR